jgi:hypothetical protein
MWSISRLPTTSPYIVSRSSRGRRKKGDSAAWTGFEAFVAADLENEDELKELDVSDRWNGSRMSSDAFSRNE